jgi:hypothetical protein
MPSRPNERTRRRAAIRTLERNLAVLTEVARDPHASAETKLGTAREIRLCHAKLLRLTAKEDAKPVGRPRKPVLEDPPPPQVDEETRERLSRMLGTPLNLAPTPPTPPLPPRAPLSEERIRQILGTPRPQAALGKLPNPVVQKTDGDPGTPAPAPAPTDSSLQKTDSPAPTESAKPEPAESVSEKGVIAERAAASADTVYRNLPTVQDNRPSFHPMPIETQFFLATGRTMKPAPPEVASNPINYGNDWS